MWMSFVKVEKAMVSGACQKKIAGEVKDFLKRLRSRAERRWRKPVAARPRAAHWAARILVVPFGQACVGDGDFGSDFQNRTVLGPAAAIRDQSLPSSFLSA